ncbi:MAG: sugar-transfer associated ATP-grasp domain-containing protein [Bacteroidales bacterium]
MPEIFKRTKLQQLNEILKDPDRKPVTRIIYELFYLSFHYKELPTHYFSRYLFKKGTTNIKNYLPNRLIKKITPSFNDQKVKEVLDNKLYFNLFYSQSDISLPKILMYNHRNIFIAGKKRIEINNILDFTALLDEIFKQNPLSDSIFIKKTYSSASGRNIYKLYLHQIKANPEVIGEVFSEVIKSEYLFQETVKQHPELNKLNPSSLNTIRFDSFIDKDGKVDIISAFLKMSTNNSHVDNNIAGGCGVGIDLKSGRLKKSGYSKIKISGVKVLTSHPVTKTIFEDLKVPFFNEAKELVLNTAGLLPELRLVGWDVAIGESGPILIEGNSDYGINSNDLMYGGYLSNPTFRKVLHEYNYL